MPAPCAFVGVVGGLVEIKIRRAGIVAHAITITRACVAAPDCAAPFHAEYAVGTVPTKALPPTFSAIASPLVAPETAGATEWPITEKSKPPTPVAGLAVPLPFH